MKYKDCLVVLVLLIGLCRVSLATQGVFDQLNQVSNDNANEQQKEQGKERLQSEGLRQEHEYRMQEAAQAAELAEKQRRREYEYQVQQDEQKKLSDDASARKQILDRYRAGLISKNDARAAMLLLDDAVELYEPKPGAPKQISQHVSGKKTADAAAERILLDIGCDIRNLSKDKNAVYRGGKKLAWRDLGGAAWERFHSNVFPGLTESEQQQLIGRYFSE